ncbi:MAG: DUF1122 family protein [Desulfosalsimonas sp.]
MDANKSHYPLKQPETLSGLLDQLVEGIDISEGRVYCRTVQKGRLDEQRDMVLYFRSQEDECRLMHASLFFGRSGIFNPWVELYNIQNPLTVNNITFALFDSDLEYSLIGLFLRALEPGGKIFAEYENDPETAKALKLGVPPPVSRMGHILFQNGATWFKDWYYPEGFMEGGRKLQGEKPLTSQAKNRHIDSIREELQDFLKTRGRQKTTGKTGKDPVERALKRAGAMLETPLFSSV